MPIDDDIPADYRARIEAEYKLAMTPAERALVDEWDQLEALRHAGSLSADQQKRWYWLTLQQDDIWSAALMRKFQR